VGEERTRLDGQARSRAGRRMTRFKQAQKEFIQVAGIADFDPRAKAHSAEFREEMKRASQEIAKDPAACAPPNAKASLLRSGISFDRPKSNVDAKRAVTRARIATSTWSGKRLRVVVQFQRRRTITRLHCSYLRGEVELGEERHICLPNNPKEGLSQQTRPRYSPFLRPLRITASSTSAFSEKYDFPVRKRQ
jgi:hypothetical protein